MLRQAEPTVTAARPCPVRAGLTVVELLIVLSIMGLLIALLVPVTGCALEEADMVQCRARLRELGLGTRLYAKDHDGVLPVSDVLDGPHPALVGALKDYLNEPRLYFCPGETKPDGAFSDASFQQGRIGYFYFSCEKTPTNPTLSVFLRSSTMWPRRLYTGMESRTWVFSDRWFSGERTAHGFYKKGVNYLVLGGDVQTVTESPREAFQ